ncbi:MAG: CBS domain-containing protein, partial [Planctomycetaceae bacterium]|nr:CBS domain-containing protein [Planctomycetaceae bacterium]
EERRDFMRLSQYPEGTAGAVMTSEVAKLSERLTVREALDELGRVADEVETIYYLYVVDEDDHLRGVVSARQLVSAIKTPQMPLSEIMDRNVLTARPYEDQEEVANKVANLDLLAIPVVDQQQRMLGIITHDDVIDVVREEATEDAHRSAAVEPLDETYLKTPILILSWKRGIWLSILFFFALLTA